jgi:predicted lysophospholipase L1 biosynthesis ABC-type transport system permease subunit
MNAFSLGPRVIIDYHDAEAAGLLTFGSRTPLRTLFKTRDGESEPLSTGCREQLKSTAEHQCPVIPHTRRID